jgi:hypothetical protein
MFVFITAVEFNGASQDSCDPEIMLAEKEVDEAIAHGDIPVSPMNSALHTLHDGEKAVQAYLKQHNMKTGLEYRSVFVGIGPATAVDEVTARKYGHPFLVRPQIARELSVASLGDLQNVVSGLGKTEAGFPADDRIVDLDSAEDRLKALEQLCLRAQEHNAKVQSNFVYVEARLCRDWTRGDLERPCNSDDFRKVQKAGRRGFRRVNSIIS